MAIRRVVLADGKVDESAGWGKPERKRVIADWVAAKVTDVLEQNIRYGTGYPNATLYDRPAAGKTGTTEDWVDAWFCGYTPRLSTTVWMGYPQGRVPMTNVHGIPVTGGSFPAQIWHSFMTAALDGTPPLEFPEPKTEPHWRSDFTRGHYQLGYVPVYTPTTETTTEASETTAAEPTTAPAKTTTRKAPPTTVEPPPPPPPPTTAPPPPPATTTAAQ